MFSPKGKPILKYIASRLNSASPRETAETGGTETGTGATGAEIGTGAETGRGGGPGPETSPGTGPVRGEGEAH